VRKLHAAELLHLREVLAEQQAQIEALQAEVQDLQRSLSWADSRADMFHDALNDAVEARPCLSIGLSTSGQLGLLQ
jgi:uncharacterized protein YlxW (UPF0749 family)